MSAELEVRALVPAQAAPVPAELLAGPATPAGAHQLVHGLDAVRAVLAEVDALGREVGLPATARAAWVAASLEEGSSTFPWAVLVRGGSGRLSAAAVLLDDLDTGATTLAGTAGGYRGGLAARDVAGARALGLALAEGARTRGPASAWELGPVPDDAVTRAVAAAAGLAVSPGLPVPSVRRPETPGAHVVSSNHRKTLRKARNRIEADGLTAVIRVTRAAAEIEEALPALAAAYRDRDHAHELPCALDTPRGLRTWQARVRALAATGDLELSVLALDGELAAYVLGLRDGDRRGVLEGRFLTRFARYAPGRLLEADVLERALADASVRELDWMTGVAPDTLLAATHREDVVVLRRAG